MSDYDRLDQLRSDLGESPIEDGSPKNQTVDYLTTLTEIVSSVQHRVSEIEKIKTTVENTDEVGPANNFQILASQVYAEGQFENAGPLENIGDSLFLFLWSELSDDAECTDIETAIQRMRNAEEEILRVKQAFIEKQENS